MDTESRKFIGGTSLVVACLAVLLSSVGIGLAVRNGRSGGGSEGAKTAEVALSEFAITPKVITVESGDSTLHVVNKGSVPHNLTIEGGPATADIEGGKSADLPLGGLKKGTYKVKCAISGHDTSGMVGTLTVKADGTGSASGATASGDASGGGGHKMTAEEMDKSMLASLAAFPAKTKGLGGEVLEPVIGADGAKEFTLTAEVVDWEVSPGKTVKAWTYNGTVPGPTIKVNVGDKLRIKLINKLPESTSIHFHGLTTPNSMDGTAGITQDPVKSGGTFVYEFPAVGPAVGMYHSHHLAVHQVPDGMAGSIIIGSVLPAATQVVQEYPMILNDSGVIGLTLNGKSFPATAPIAINQGDKILVHYMNEGVMAHPMHLHGVTQTVVAKDGVPLAQPYEADTINVAPGERYSVVITGSVPGTWVWHCHILTHAEDEKGMFGMVTALIIK